MKKIKFKKRGNVMITMLFFAMLIMILTAIIFSHLTSVEGSRKAQEAVQIIAETRALAIDIPLKERYGYVEILHKPYTYVSTFPVQPLYNQVIQGYDTAILSPDQEAYKQRVEFADASAKQAGITYINGVTADNGNGTKLLSVKPENICIGVYSLPVETISEEKIGCGPITKPGKTNTVVNFWQTGDEVSIYGSTHRLNGFTGETDDLQNTIQNYNYVFVMLTYQEETFFYKTIQRFIHGSDETKWSDPPTRAVWSIAYPQTDFCTGADC